MYLKNIKYVDYDGVEREETFYFNLSKAEITEMELGTAGGLTAILEKLVKSPNTPALAKMYKDLILKSYGEKSDDGRYFRKVSDTGVPLNIAFSQSMAYSEIYMNMLNSRDAAFEFIRGICPVEISDEDFNNAVNKVE